MTGAILLGSVARADDPFLHNRADLEALATKAPAALKEPIVAITAKPQPSPTGDDHDYVSYARYYWPDPSKPDGLPYLSRDGHHNLEQVAKGDHERLWKFAESVGELAAAAKIHRDEAAALRAVEWLRVWLIDPQTRMNPNLEFAQVRLGHDHNHGSSSGVLDARCLAEVIDAVRGLHGSAALSPKDESAILDWFTKYLDWLQSAKNARAEHAAKNNHGSWFLAQMIPIARYCGRDDLARDLCAEDRARIGWQIRPDGSQPEEIRRVDGLSYSQFNLEAQFQIARQAAGLGIDLWHYTAPGGGSLQKAFAFLKPYNAHPEKWPTSENATLKPGFMDELAKEAERVWPKE
ncbi:MAG TPA: alginate lyase family protein [Candidatus Didemnitutus sp.]|nr:alginate lyase family protein [Candidatus Didemnitutus sp.]